MLTTRVFMFCGW